MGFRIVLGGFGRFLCWFWDGSGRVLVGVLGGFGDGFGKILEGFWESYVRAPVGLWDGFWEGGKYSERILGRCWEGSGGVLGWFWEALSQLGRLCGQTISG